MPMFSDNDLFSYRIRKNLIQETTGESKSEKRDPLEGIDKLAIVDTKVHGQSLREDKKVKITNYDTSEQKNAQGHGKSDADFVTDDEQGNPPTKPDTTKLKDHKRLFPAELVI